MFERFTDQARRLVVLAQEESRFRNHAYIGTEHLLLGLIGDRESVASDVLTSLGADPDTIRDSVISTIGRGEGDVPAHIPFTPRAKTVLELSLREAIELGHHHVGSEHILLGLIGEGQGVAAQVLGQLGIAIEPARARIVETVGAGDKPPPTPISGTPPPTPLTRQVQDPALVSLLFVAVALVAVVIEPPEQQVRLWGLSLLLAGVLVWAGGAVIGTGAPSGPRSHGMGRLLRVLGGLTLAAAASVFVLGALLL